MPHFAVDESAHSHRKVVRAGNAAFGLWARLGSYACDHLSDGVIPAEIAGMYGTAPQIKKLVSVGMLHPAGHNCRCPQPEPGDFMLHDYLIDNPSRGQVAQSREKAAEKKRRQRAANDPASNRDGNEEDSSSNREGIEDEKSSKKSAFPEEGPGQWGASPGDDNGTRAHARPSPPPSPSSPPMEEKKEASKRRETALDLSSSIPEQARPLVDGLTAAGVIVRWPFKGNEWFPLLALIAKTGIPAMVDHAAKVAARTSVESAKYFLNGWAELPPIPAPGADRPALRAVDAPRPQLTPQATRRQASRDVLDQLTAQMRNAAGGDQ